MVAGQMHALDAACEQIGRDPASINRLVLTGFQLSAPLDAFAEASEAYEAAGVTDLVVHWPRASEPFAGDPSMLASLRG